MASPVFQYPFEFIMQILVLGQENIQTSDKNLFTHKWVLIAFLVENAKFLPLSLISTETCAGTVM